MSMFSPYHWLPRVTTLSVELFASTLVTMDENDKNDHENDDIGGAGNSAGREISQYFEPLLIQLWKVGALQVTANTL